MLPFDSLLDADEPLTLSNGLQIPRFGSLTLNEALAAQQLASSEAIATLNDENAIAANWLAYQLLATLLISFRVQPGWKLEETQALPAEDILRCAEWFLGERDWWGEAPEPTEGGEDIDWSETYLRLKLDYPNEPWINRRDFANQPLHLIRQYLEVARQREYERLANEARVTANLAVMMAVSNGAKNPKARHFNEFENALFVQRAVREFPPALAVDLLELMDRGKVPDWVCESVDLEQVRASAGTVKDG